MSVKRRKVESKERVERNGGVGVHQSVDQWQDAHGSRLVREMLSMKGEGGIEMLVVQSEGKEERKGRDHAEHRT